MRVSSGSTISTFMLSFFFSSSLNSMLLSFTRMAMGLIKLSLQPECLQAADSRPLAHFFFGFFLVAFGLVFTVARFFSLTWTTFLPRGYIVPHILQTSTSHHLASSVATILMMHALSHNGHLLVDISILPFPRLSSSGSWV